MRVGGVTTICSKVNFSTLSKHPQDLVPLMKNKIIVDKSVITDYTDN
jgi:hypothetical protein